MKYFEDIRIGDRAEYGELDVTAADIKRFAEKYDPQPFHLDEEAGKATHFGGLAASGWHTAAMTMKLLITGSGGEHVASLGSPGFDDLRWRRPVRPGDRLRVTSEAIDKKPSESRPEMGVVRFQVQTLNQDDEVVMSVITIAMIARKEAA